MQCDVHARASGPGRGAVFLLDVQADLLSELDTRAVVPLIQVAAFGRRGRGLHPLFTVAGEDVVMATHLLAAVRRNELGPVVASLRAQRDVIIAAIDVLLSGV
jgi:toxin CcdB